MNKVKIYIFVTLLIVLSSLVNGYCCEQGRQCNITETCSDGNCGACSIIIYDNGLLLLNENLTKQNDYLYYYQTNNTLFSSYTQYPYIINCTNQVQCIGDCKVDVRNSCGVESMSPISIVIVLPIILSVLFFTFAFLLSNQKYWALRLGLALLGFVSPLFSFGYSILSINKFYGWTELSEIIAFNVWVYAIILFVIISTLLLYFVIDLFKYMSGSYETQ